jgi:hypothetical protein
LPSVFWVKMNWQKCVIWLFSPSSRHRLFSLLRKEWHFVSPRAQIFIIIAIHFLVLKLLALPALGRLSALPGSISEEIRFSESVLELASPPQCGLVCDSSFTVCSSDFFSQPSCLLNWRGWIWWRMGDTLHFYVFMGKN